MRALILVACAALAFSACSREEAADDTMNADANLVSENLTVDANQVNVVTTDNATDNAVETDLTTNEADTNLANGM